MLTKLRLLDSTKHGRGVMPVVLTEISADQVSPRTAVAAPVGTTASPLSRAVSVLEARRPAGVDTQGFNPTTASLAVLPGQTDLEVILCDIVLACIVLAMRSFELRT